MKSLNQLFITFAKIGMFTFGGGYAMIPLIEHECVDKKHWITSEELMNITVIAESTPGPIAIMDNLLKYDIAVKVFKGIRIAVGLLIIQAGITMVRKMMKLLNFSK